MLVVADHLILTLHTNAGIMREDSRHFVTALGQAGVLAFFVHTSLVLMYSLERMHKKSDDVIFSFYVRRFFRIYPLAVATIVVALICHIPSKTWDVAKTTSHAGVLANFLLIQNLWTKEQVLSPLWSLPYEVQMYIVLPFLYQVAIKRKGPRLLIALIASFAFLGVIVARATAHLNMAAYVPCFLSGVLCFSLRHKVRAVVPSWLWPCFLLLIIGTYAGISSGEEPTYWSGWIFCLLLGLTINAFRDSEDSPGTSTAAYVCLYSYGIYLLHIPAFYLVFVVFKTNNLLIGITLAVALTISFSILAFHGLESPFIELGRRLSGESQAEAQIAEPVPRLRR